MKEKLSEIGRRHNIRVEWFDSVTSTNDVARKPEMGHGDIVVAASQTAGRGQRGNSWSSAEGQNLTFSIVLRPTFLSPANQFLLSELVSVAIHDVLLGYGILTKIKWPNDIYAADRKIAGILIENDIKGTSIYRSIVGIGINVNQTEFAPSLPNPTSMKQVLQSADDIDLIELLSGLADAILGKFRLLEDGYSNGIELAYHHNLYRVGQQYPYLLPDGTRLDGTILHVRQSGELMLRHDDGTINPYLHKEIEFAI